MNIKYNFDQQTKNIQLFFEKDNMEYDIVMCLDIFNDVAVYGTSHVKEDACHCSFCDYFESEENKEDHLDYGNSKCTMFKGENQAKGQKVLIEVLEALHKKERTRFLVNYNINLETIIKKVKHRDLYW